MRRKRLEVPLVRQETDYTCGAAAVLAVARYWGVAPATERAVHRDMGGFGREGSDPVHLTRALRRYQLRHVEQRGMSFHGLRVALDAGFPVILTLQAYDGGHWIVAVGHDRDGITYVDPMLDGERGRFSWRELARRWHDIEGRPTRKLVRYGLVVGGSEARRRSAAARPSARRSAPGGRRSRSA